MIKYEEALHALAHYSGFLYTSPKMPLEEAMVTMKELVDKATPKELEAHIRGNWITWRCHACGSERVMNMPCNYCPDCGQAIKRSEE